MMKPSLLINMYKIFSTVVKEAKPGAAFYE